MIFARRLAAPVRFAALALLALVSDASVTAVLAAGNCPALSARVAANTSKKIEVLTITAQPCVIKLMLYDAGDPQAEEALRPLLGRKPQFGSAEIASREVVYTVPQEFRGRAAFTVTVEGIGDPVTIVIQASEWASSEKE